MISFSSYRDAYLETAPEATEAQIARAYMEYIGPPQFLDELGRGVARGAGQVLEGIGAAVRILSGDQAGRSAVELGQALIEAYPRNPELAGSIIEQPELLANPSWWAGGVGELAPFLIPQAGVAGAAIRAGVSTGRAIAGASAVGGVLEGAPTFNRLYDEQGAGFGESALKAGANIAGISALNLLPLSRAFGYGPQRGAFNRVLTTALGEGVTEVAEEPLGAFIEGNDPVQATIQGLNVFPVAALTGGLLGGVGGAVQPGPQTQAPPPFQGTPLEQSMLTLEDPQYQDPNVETPLSPWRQDEQGDLVFTHDNKLLQQEADLTQDVKLSDLLDDPVAYEAYPQLADIPVSGLPKKLKGMTSRSVPGRIEVARDLKGEPLQAALNRELERQIAFRERIVLPGKKVELDAMQQEKLDETIASARKAFDLAEDDANVQMLYDQAQQALAPSTPESLTDITLDQGAVALRLSPRSARLLIQARQDIDTTQATQRAAGTPEQEPSAATQPIDRPQDEAPAASTSADGSLPPNKVPPSQEPPGDSARPTGSGSPPSGGGTPITEDYRVGNIQAGRITTDADAIEVLDALHDLNEHAINLQRREVVPVSVTHELAKQEWARQHGMYYKEFLETPLGKAGNATDLDAGHAILTDLWARTTQAIKRFNEDPSELNEARAYIEADLLLQGFKALSGQIAEAGRALNILRKTGINQESIKGILEDHPDGKHLLSLLDSSKDLGEALSVRRKWEKAKLSDVLLEVWLASLLSGPTTQVVNGLSSSLTSWLFKGELMLAMGMGKLVGSQAITYADAVAYSTASMSDVIEALRTAKHAWQTEKDVFDSAKLDTHRMAAITAKRLGVKKGAAYVDMVGRGIRVPFRLLLATDAYYKTRAYRRRLRQLAVRKALKENPKATQQELQAAIEETIAEPNQKMKADAKRHAEYLTFTNPTGVIAGSLKRMISHHPVLKIVFPFVQTPANILKFAFARTPLGGLMKQVRAEMMGKKGPEAQLMAISRMTLGSSIMGLIGYMAAEGLVTGAPPEDSRERRLWYARGLQPYSLKIGDKWIAYGRLEPLGIILGITADFITLQDAIELNGDETLAEQLIQSLVGGMARNMLSKTYLKGLSDLVLAITDPERYGDRYIQSFTGTIIPTGVAQLQRADDPYLRYTTSVWERIQSRIPGLAERLPRRVDVFGNDIRLTPEGVPSALNLVNPLYVRQYANDPVAKELLRMDVLVSPVRKKIGEYTLTPLELMDYQRTVGKLMHAQLGNLIRSPLYQFQTDIQKRDALEKSRRDAMKLGRQIFLARNPRIMIESRSLLFAERDDFSPRSLLIE